MDWRRKDDGLGAVLVFHRYGVKKNPQLSKVAIAGCLRRREHLGVDLDLQVAGKAYDISIYDELVALELGCGSEGRELRSVDFHVYERRRYAGGPVAIESNAQDERGAAAYAWQVDEGSITAPAIGEAVGLLCIVEVPKKRSIVAGTQVDLKGSLDLIGQG
jgi:hypothetical protein